MERVVAAIDPKLYSHNIMSNTNQEPQSMLSPKSIALTGLFALVLAPITGGSSVGVWACHVGVGSAIDSYNKTKSDNE